MSPARMNSCPSLTIFMYSSRVVLHVGVGTSGGGVIGSGVRFVGCDKFRHDRLDLRDGVCVSRIHVSLDERVGKDAQSPRAMVEGEQCLRDEKQALRQIEIIRRRRRDGRLEEPHHVVAQIPDRTADKARLHHGRRGDQLVFRHQRFEFAQRIASSSRTRASRRVP